jgi:hypothetical protein
MPGISPALAVASAAVILLLGGTAVAQAPAGSPTTAGAETESAMQLVTTEAEGQSRTMDPMEQPVIVGEDGINTLWIAVGIALLLLVGLVVLLARRSDES